MKLKTFSIPDPKLLVTQNEKICFFGLAPEYYEVKKTLMNNFT